MATTDGKKFIEHNASRWDAMQRDLLAASHFAGSVKADHHAKKLAITFEMSVPSVILLEITAVEEDDDD